MRNQDRHRNLYEDPAAVLMPNYDLNIFLMAIISHSVLLFLRRDIGYRLLQRWVFCTLVLVLSGAGYMSATAPHASARSQEGGLVMILFAVAMAYLFVYHRRRALKAAFRDVDPVHSMSRGNSLLGPFFRRFAVPEWFVQRWIEPLGVFGTGVYLILELHWGLLGWWLAVAGTCLAGIEDYTLRQANNAILDVRDAQIEGRLLKEASGVVSDGQARQHTTKPAAPPPPASLSPEIMRMQPGDFTVKQRRGD
jgi:hypothetical protein